MLRKLPSRLTMLAVVCTLTAVSEPIFDLRQVAFAQSPAPAAPATVPEGTTVRINSSNSMAALSQALKQKFEGQFAGTKVELGQGNTDEALQALREGKVDLAAIGRSLTPAEKAEGLVQSPVTRRKIAVVVGENNPFPGDLTGEQFAAIFRGEITNWSQVGGPDRAIRFIDRPNSDTRSALQPYPVFQSAPFQTGATAVPVERENVDAMIRELGDDGISYAILDQVQNKSGIKIVTLYGTPPTDPSYPFSQALTYVYKDPANPAVQAFLGYATAPENQQALASVNVGESGSRGLAGLLDIFRRDSAPAASPEAPASPEAAPPAASPAPDPATAPPAADSAPAPGEAASPAPTDPNAATAPDPNAAPTDPNAAPADPNAVAQAPDLNPEGARAGLPPWLWLLSIPILAALIWALLRGSDRPADAVAGAEPVAAGLADQDSDNSRIVLASRSNQEAYAYWEVPEAHKQRIRKEEGGQQLAVRLYDVTGQDPERHPAHSIEQFEVEETDQDLLVPIPRTDRDYMAEIGYVTYQGRWCPLARSAPVYIGADGTSESYSPDHSDHSEQDFTGRGLAADPGDFGSSATVSERRFDQPSLVDRFGTGNSVSSTEAESPSQSETLFGAGADRPDLDNPLATGAALAGGAALGAAGAAGAASQRNRVRRSQIVLVPRNSQDAYAYWEVLEHHKEIAKQHGGQNFVLRICDVTGVDLDQQAPHSIQQFNCEETDNDRHITVPDNGEYVAEIGYLAKNGRWLRIARSAPVMIPAVDARSTSLPFS